MVDDENRIDAATAPHYTREGDDGTTSFGGVGPVGKGDLRLAAHADCGEANAAIGAALALGGGLPVHVITTLGSIQHDLFDLVTGLEHPGAEKSGTETDAAHITQSHIDRVEKLCDHYSKDLSLVDGFVLPGGTVTAALLFQAWAVARRAERTTWSAIGEHGEISPMCARYLNRLSNLLYVLARAANAEHGDTMWYPMASVSSQVTAAAEPTED